MTPQEFHKGDELETRVASVFGAILTSLDLERDNFYDGAFLAQELGQVLWNLERDPIVGVVSETTYRTSFSLIHDLFTRPGTFEYYLSLFRKIWGDEVEVTFDVPSPGILNITINAVDALLFDFIARKIVSDAYVYEEVIDSDGDNIAFQGTVGIKTQDEVDRLIKEISPANIVTSATLTIS